MYIFQLCVIPFLLQETMGTAGIKMIYNLMSVHEESGVNITRYWTNVTDNDPLGDKSLLSLPDVIPGGTFRSALVDDWDLEPPHEVALILVDMNGVIKDWVAFNTSDVTNSSLMNWITVGRIVASSFNFDSEIEVVWMESACQLAILTRTEPPTSWFAVADRNFSKSEIKKPYFLVPRNKSSPFRGVPDTHVRSWLFWPKSYIEFDLEFRIGPGSKVALDITLWFLYSFTFTLEYSFEACSHQNKTMYMDPLTNTSKVFASHVLHTLPFISVRCMWFNVSYDLPIIKVTLTELRQEEDYISYPVAVFKGFWYEEKLPEGTSEASKFLNLTKDITYLPDIPTTSQHMSTSEKPAGSVTMSTSSGQSPTESLIMSTESGQHSTQNDTTTTKVQRSETTSIENKLPTSSFTTKPEMTSQACSSCSTPLEQCTCPCTDLNNADFDLEKRLHELQESLTIDKHELSSYKRSHESADDNRQSAVYMGYIGGIILCVCIFVIVSSDLISLCSYMRAKHKYKCK